MTRLVDIVRIPKHWDPNRGSMIPATWHATVHTDKGMTLLQAGTRDEIITLIADGYPELI